jgi:hypothetical protein
MISVVADAGRGTPITTADRARHKNLNADVTVPPFSSANGRPNRSLSCPCNRQSSVIADCSGQDWPHHAIDADPAVSTIAAAPAFAKKAFEPFSSAADTIVRG